jgi:hypothetical protein
MNRISSTILALVLAGAGAARAQLAITEIMSSAASTSNGVAVVQNSDFWELTNFGTNDLDLTGYKWNDNAGGLIGADPTPFTGVIIHGGESIIFFESNVAMNVSSAQVRAWWGLPGSVQVIPYIGNGLSSSGDGVVLWGPGAANDGDVVDRVDFLVAIRGRAFIPNPTTGVFDMFSTNGVGGAFKAVTADDFGSPGTTTGPVPMAVATQPANSSVNPGDTATFTVGWRGLPRPKFQWQFEGVDIAGARFATLSVPNVQLDKLGRYRVVLNNGVETLMSSNATLAINPQPTPPQFVVSPQNKSAFLGQNVTFTAQASGVPQPTYQWRHNDADITGATSASLNIPNAAYGDAGFYSVVASNPSGAATNSATLVVTRRPALKITEVCAAQSTNGASGGHNDWWELTNFDDFTVDLHSYRFDDNSAALSFSTVLSNATSIAPGESVIFVEGMSPAAFRAWWGADNLPTNLQIISYTGAGLGLSSLGDALNLWNSNASEDFDTVASEVFSTATTGVTFGWNPEAEYFGDLSINGLYGAFRAVDGSDLGSPGYIRAPMRPRLLSISRELDGCHLRWTSLASRNYTVQYKISLTDANWTPLATLPATGPFLSTTDEDLGSPQKFYRIVLEP